MIATTALKQKIDLMGLVSRYTKVQKVAGIHGGEYAGPCPRCGGRDRFRVQPERGLWWCRQCSPNEHWQDAIDFVMWMEGLSFKDACAKLDGEPIPVRIAPPPKPAPAPEPDEGPPSEAWQRAAKGFVRWAEAMLWGPEGEKALVYLREQRGLKDETIRRWRLGYNPADDWREPGKWGLEGKKIWLPKGIVIPCFTAGVLWYVKVRRPLPGDELEAYIGPGKGRSDEKYIHPRGSRPELFGAETLLGLSVAVLTEGEFDGLLLHQVAGHLVGVASLGSASKGLSVKAMRYLLPVARLLVAYDMDEAGEKGATALLGLSSRMRRAKVPMGKDITDFWKHGGRLKDWIEYHLARLELETAPKEERTAAIVADADTCPKCGGLIQRRSSFVYQGKGYFWCGGERCLAMWIPLTDEELAQEYEPIAVEV